MRIVPRGGAVLCAGGRGRPVTGRRPAAPPLTRTARGGSAAAGRPDTGQLLWMTWVTPLMICCTAIAESIIPASLVTSTTPPSLITRMISSE